MSRNFDGLLKGCRFKSTKKQEQFIVILRFKDG